jgi:hypothetical protein
MLIGVNPLRHGQQRKADQPQNTETTQTQHDAETKRALSRVKASPFFSPSPPSTLLHLATPGSGHHSEPTTASRRLQGCSFEKANCSRTVTFALVARSRIKIM